MKVKLGDVWYDSAVTPICIKIDKEEQQQIAMMDEKQSPQMKYARFPLDSGLSPHEMLEWMDT